MREQLERRLQELKQEYESGQKVLAELEKQQASLRDTMLRISGAVQVLEEELRRDEPGRAAALAMVSEGAPPPEVAVAGSPDGVRPEAR